MIKSYYLTTVLLLFAIMSCGDGMLRGKEISSPDGETYLVVMDDNGGGCGPILVDGSVWHYEIGEKGVIKSGIHSIECGGSIEFEIREGTIFYFDYWGP